MEVEAWLSSWGGCIRACDYDAARALFAEEVFSFGTFTDEIDGLSDLIELQWREIWPYTAKFKFQIDRLHTIESGDDSMITAACLWSSVGLDGDQASFPRNGRATIVLRRGEAGRLKAVHTHFSMCRGSPVRADLRATS